MEKKKDQGQAAKREHASFFEIGLGRKVRAYHDAVPTNIPPD